MHPLTAMKTLMDSSSVNPAVSYFLDAVHKGTFRSYNKYGQVKAMKVLQPTKVVTVIDGKTETTNMANVGDYIVTGARGEQYVLTAAQLAKRYQHVKGDVYNAVGHCYAIKYKGKKFSFRAPWGEDMICEPNDYICSTALDGTDVYRIEKTAFLSTYRRM